MSNVYIFRSGKLGQLQIEIVKIIYFKRFEYLKPFVPNESSTAKKKICLEIGHNGYLYIFFLSCADYKHLIS